jgi:hypothetical protein
VITGIKPRSLNNHIGVLKMTITTIGIIVTALAIYLDRATLFRSRAYPPIAFAGVLTVIASLVM